MAVIEIRCPRCGSISHLTNEKTHEYSCDHCNATFVFVDTSKREVVRDTKRHNCPICGRPVGTGGYVCTECGQDDLCENCVDEVGHKMVCLTCLKKSGENCSTCGRWGIHRCAVCGRRECPKHAYVFDIKGEYSGFEYFSLDCPTCMKEVCKNCLVEKGGFFSSKGYYCKKCGSKLIISPPIVPSHG